jgi:hypothetical protein
MALTPILQIVQTAASEVGLPSPPAVFGNAYDLTAIQLGALYNTTGEMLVKRRVWRQLFREYSFATVAGQVNYPVPEDFARPISQTEWDRVSNWPLMGPDTPQQWQYLKSGIQTGGPRQRFRLVGNNMEIWPVPGSSSTTLSYFYVSKWWAMTAVGQPIPKATRDDDSCIFDDRLMVSGIKLRFFQAKGFDTSSFAADFQANLDDALSQDSGAPVLSMARDRNLPLISVFNIPDGSWPI